METDNQQAQMSKAPGEIEHVNAIRTIFVKVLDNF